jgi:phosphoglycolate phosphatase
MNLVFAASLWSPSSGKTGGGSGGREDWKDEFPALARRNVLALWEDVPGSASCVPPELLTFFGSPLIQGPLGRELERQGWVKDETALLGASPEAAREAALLSIPLFRVTGDAVEADRLRASGAENVFAGPVEAAAAVWKVNAVERRLFPVVTVGGLLFDDAGEVLLVRTRKWSGKWGIPGGKVDYGETLEEAFRREIREETGLHVQAAKLVLTQEAVEHPEFYRKRHFVLVNFLGRVPGSHPAVRLNHEGEDYFWGPLETALTSDARPLNGPTRVLAETAQRLIAASASSGKEGLWAL